MVYLEKDKYSGALILDVHTTRYRAWPGMQYMLNRYLLDK